VSDPVTITVPADATWHEARRLFTRAFLQAVCVESPNHAAAARRLWITREGLYKALKRVRVGEPES